MAPQEVAGLHALAKAHGGSLTVNPDTGLPEAGFLSGLLPMFIGAGLSMIPGVGPLMAAGIVGGGTTLATGSLQKGLMAGLGAYGGAGLAGGLMGAGTGALSSAAGAAGANSVVPAVATEAVVPAATEGLVGAAETLGSTVANPTGIPGFQGTGLGLTPASSAINAGQMVTQATPTITQAPALTQNAADIGNIYAQEQAAQNAVASKLAGTSAFDTAKAGFGELMKRPGDFMTKDNLKYGLAGLAPVMAESLKPKALPEKEEDSKAYEYEFSFNPTRVASGYRPIGSPSGYDSSEQQHFDPRFVRKAAGGGMMGVGPIEAMSNRNQAETLMANGGQMFAEGGKAVSKVEDNPYYTMTGQSGDVFKYLMGQGSAPAAPVRAVPVAVAPVQSTVQTAPTPQRKGAFGKLLDTFSPEHQAEVKKSVAGTSFENWFTGGSQPQDQGAGGYWVEDTSSPLKPYSFDPGLGGFRTVAPPKKWVPYAAPATATVMDYGGYAQGGIASLAQGGPSHLGDYSDGGRLLKGPGDGVSDSIPATIANKRPARLADGEFVVPARIVSELGNGSTEAGARKLYAMMDRVQKARKKSIGKNRVAVNSRAEKLLPA
jgi:hypothetical protein